MEGLDDRRGGGLSVMAGPGTLLGDKAVRHHRERDSTLWREEVA